MRKIWTPELRQKLIELYPNNSNAEVGKILNLTARAISVQASKQRLFKSAEFHEQRRQATLFAKGHKSYNKGKKWNEFMSKEGQENCLKTAFKKGQVHQKLKPIGSTRVDSYGYLYEKIRNPNIWALKHRLVWQECKGKIPKGYIVQFKDGIKAHCEIENLCLISRKDQLAQNSIIRYPAGVRTAFYRLNKLNKLLKNGK